MNSGITRQALRRHRRTLLGPAGTQVVAATVIATMLDTRESLTRSLSAPQRARLGDVMDICTVFLGDAVYLSIVIVGVTMSLALGGQLRDIALLRSVGASPSQVRRSAALQAIVTAVPSALLGVVLAMPVTAGWLALLRGHHVVPAQTTATWTPVSVPITLLAVTATSVIASLVAARRTARLKPAAALVEVAVGRRPRAVVVRTLAGLLLVAGGVVLSLLLAAYAPEQLADAGVFVLLAECIGVGLLAPALLRSGCSIARTLVPTGVVRVAADDLRAQVHRLGGALVPVMLGCAFTLVKIGMHTTVGGGPDDLTERWLDWSGSAMFSAFAAIAAVNCLLTVTTSRRRDYAAMALAGADRATVLRVVAVQAAIVSAVAALAAVAVSMVTLLPMVHATLGVWWPHLPTSAVLTAVAAIAALVLAGTVLPAARLTRRPAVRVMADAA